MGERSLSSKRKNCSSEYEQRPKRIRKQVERYGIIPQCIVPPRKISETRMSRKQTSSKLRRSSCKPRSHAQTETECVEKEEIIEEKSLELCDLSEEVLLLILERIPAFGLINLSKTSTQFHRLCVMDTIWKQRCKVS